MPEITREQQKKILLDASSRRYLGMPKKDFEAWYERKRRVVDEMLNRYTELVEIPHMEDTFYDELGRLNRAREYLTNLMTVSDTISYYRSKPDELENLSMDECLLIQPLINNQIRKEQEDQRNSL
ncbi:MAG TPA: hypothetical protein VI933_02790 [archaeon]|nr:hypothetical protein [archaeon]